MGGLVLGLVLIEIPGDAAAGVDKEGLDIEGWGIKGGLVGEHYVVLIALMNAEKHERSKGYLYSFGCCDIS